MPPHKALLTFEILHEIFGYLRPLPDLEDHRELAATYRTLAVLTRICTTWQDPATRALWSTLPSYVAALRALPEFVSGADHTEYEGSDSGEDGYVDSDDEEKDSYWTLTGPVSRSSWDRLRELTAFTRSINYTDRHACERVVLPAVWSHLLHLDVHQPLFPNLRTISGLTTSPHRPGMLQLALPSLETLVIDLSWYPTEDEDALLSDRAAYRSALNLMLLHTMKRAPLVSNISLTFNPWHFKKAPSDIFAAPHLIKMHRLRSLDLRQACRVQNIRFLTGLADLPHLSTLQIHLGVLRSSRITSKLGGFAALRELWIVTDVDHPDLLSLFSAPLLTQLLIQHRDIEYSSLSTFVYQVAQRYPSIHRFEWLLEEVYHTPTNTGDLRSLAQLLEPLFSLKQIRQLRLFRRYRRYVDPVPQPIATVGLTDLSAIAAAWTELSKLMIFIHPHDGFSHDALRLLAQHCPSLTTLELPFITFKLTTSDLDTFPVMNNKLHTLLLGKHSSVLDEELTAQLVARLFPQLCAFTANCVFKFELGQHSQVRRSDKPIMKRITAAQEMLRSSM
ncbi:hypothetical protein C8Q76DRAFT_239553 [Earliella scabrosa]|nr:hypothetical protein C8Q76DRAFT_239553 [Earliella scabrosa]